MLGLSEQGLQSSYHLGAVWETFVFSELRKHLLATPQATLWFYRDRKEEVDFLINLEGKLHLLECKWAEQVDQSAVASLERVRSYFSDLTGNNYLVTRTPTPYPLGQNSRAINGFELHELSLD